MEDGLNVSEKLLMDVAEQLGASADPALLNEWVKVLDGLAERAEQPDAKSQRALLDQFSRKILESPEALSARLKERLAADPHQVAVLMHLCMGLVPAAVSQLSPLLQTYEPILEQVHVEMVKIGKMPAEARSELERAWLSEFL